MLISENQLQKLIRQILLEQGSFSAAPEKVISVVKSGKGNYTYEIFSNGKIQIMSKDGKQYPQPIVLNQKQAQAVAAEQIRLGNKGTVVANIANGTLVAPAPAAPTPAPAAGGSSSFGGQEFSQSAQYVGRGGWKYQVYNNGKIDVVAQGKRIFNPPTTLDAAKAKLVAAELQKMGNTSQVVANIAAGTLTYETGATGPTTTEGLAAGGFAFLGKGNFLATDEPLRSAGVDEKTRNIINTGVSKLVGQGHGFIMIVDPKDGTLHRFDFGRYKEAKDRCKDDRLSSLGPIGAALRDAAIATTGIVLYKRSSVKAKFSADRKQILNIPQMLAGSGLKTSGDGKLQCLLIPVSNASGALQAASSMVNKCYPYAIPIAAALQSAMNCGTFAQKILNLAQPVGQTISVETATLIDSPDFLFQNAQLRGYQLFNF
jgi:hypothetical protein